MEDPEIAQPLHDVPSIHKNSEEAHVTSHNESISAEAKDIEKVDELETEPHLSPSKVEAKDNNLCEVGELEPEQHVLSNDKVSSDVQPKQPEDSEVANSSSLAEPLKSSGYNLDFLDNLENPESAQPEEAIIPKTKGYNLDFLDNLDNPENAQPFGSPSSHKTSSEAQVDAPNGSIPAEDEG